MGQYIPDLTERFPEGFGGVDMTPSYFGETVDWDRAYKGEDGDLDDYLDSETPMKFKLGEEYHHTGIFGGITWYKVEKIDYDKGKILLSETWIDVDGEGTRLAKWHNFETDENNNERVLLWTSKAYGDIWLYA